MSQTTPITEVLSQGLVTSRDPASLLEGELPVAAQAWYMPNDLAIYKAKGRTKYLSSNFGAAVKGLRYVEFDNSTNQLIAYVGSMYYRMDMESSESTTATAALLSNFTITGISGTTASSVITATGATTFAGSGVNPGYAVTVAGGTGTLPANTTLLNSVTTTTVQLSAAPTNAFNGTETVTFTSSVGSGNTLEAIQYNNKHYLLNGVSNFVFENLATTATGSSLSFITRLHGLAAVTDAPTVVTATGGHWNASLGIGYWHFVTTEVIYPDSKDEIESTNTVKSSDIPSAQIVSADINVKYIKVTRPTIITNPSATHWRVYGAVNKDAPTPPPLSSFQLMGQQSISSTFCVIGDLQNLSTVTCGAASSTAGTWNVPTFAQGASDGKFAWSEISGSTLTCGTFVASTFTAGTMAGIEVIVRAGFLNGGGVDKTVSVDVLLTHTSGTATTTQSQQITTRKSSSNFQTLKFGNNSDTWGLDPNAWTAAMVTATGFGAKITVNRVGTAMTNCYIDSVTIKTYVTNTSASITPYGSYFPVIGISVGGVTSIIGSHGLPPTATTGDIFDDQLVTNDVTDLSIIRYSLAGQPEYFPPLYSVNFETKFTDSVTNIGRIGNVLCVGLKNNIYRVNYLPRESDAEFDRGRCYEPLAEGYGIVGTQAATNVTLPGGNIVRAFVSYSGVHVTDGFSVQTWTDDIAWFATVSTPAFASSVDYLKNCILVDYPVNYQLWLFYTPLAVGTTNTKALIFHYHPSHVKANGKPKITGPITVNAGAACLGRVSDMPVLLSGGDTGDASGGVYIEDRGYVDNSLTATANVSGFSVRTREMYMAGSPGRAVTVDTTFVQCRPDTTSTVSVTPRTRFGGEAQAAISAKTFTTTNGGASEVPFSMNAESIDYTFAESGDTGQRIRLTSIISEVVSDGLGERRS